MRTVAKEIKVTTVEKLKKLKKRTNRLGKASITK
jgi:hypothetical protein